MTILILHGIMGKAGENWMQWLYDKLIPNHNVIMPNLPSPDRPDRGVWFKTITNLLANVTDDIVIVGHSLGVTSALDYCESTPKKIKAVISVSGFHQPYGHELNDYFLKERVIDINKVKGNVNSFCVIYGDNDPYVPQDVLRQLATDLDVQPIIVKNGGHMNASAGYIQLPEVLEYIRQL